MNAAGGGGGGSNAGFGEFFEGWLVRQEHYLDELQSCRAGQDSSEDDIRELVSRILAHYQQYYDEKSKITLRNIFLLFSPTWFTPLERAFLWIGGFKPGLAFRLLSLAALTDDQAAAVALLVKDTKAAERSLDDELAKIHESVASPMLIGIARRGRRPVDGEIVDEDNAMDSLRGSLEAVVAAADSLRTRTVLKVVEVLRPVQSVEFLAAAAQLQLKIRSWGLERSLREGEGEGDT